VKKLLKSITKAQTDPSLTLRMTNKKLCHVERSETTAQTIVLHFSRSFASLRMTKRGGRMTKKILSF